MRLARDSARRLGEIVLRAILIATAMLIAAPAAAKSDPQLWTGGSVSAKLDPRWSLNAEGVARFGDKERGLFQVVVAGSLAYRLGKGVTVSAGYVHSPNYAGGRLAYTERRFRQQLSVDQIAAIGPVTLSGRLRLEERRRDGLAGTGWRVRPMVRANLPIGHDVTLFASHESFFNLSDTSWQQSGHDRMRDAIGVAFPVIPGVKAEAGLIEQHVRVRGGPDEGDHIAALSLAWSL